MNNRLKKIIELIDNGLGVIDVGTDHGYLPIYLFNNNYSGNIFASDINPLPLNKAKENANKAKATGIQFLLSNGLEKCNPDLVDNIVIAGLGGDTICQIIDEANWTMNSKYKLILQPMTKSEVLRYWLVNNGYSIIEEYLVKDSGKIYSIIVSNFSGINESYNDAELYIGKSYNNLLFDYYYSYIYYKIEKVINNLNQSKNDKSKTFYQNIIEELNNIKNEKS